MMEMSLTVHADYDAKRQSTIQLKTIVAYWMKVSLTGIGVFARGDKLKSEN